MLRIFAVAVLVGISLAAGPIYSSFDPGMSYSANGATLGFGAALGNGGISDAFEFSPSVSGSVLSITTVITYVYQPPSPTGPNNLTFWLFSNGADGPGTLLETYSYSGPSGSTIESTITLNSVLNPFLSAGTEYWFAAGPVDPVNSGYGWQENDAEQYPALYTNYSQELGSGGFWRPSAVGVATSL
jgi:hypothetical protein